MSIKYLSYINRLAEVGYGWVAGKEFEVLIYEMRCEPLAELQ